MHWKGKMNYDKVRDVEELILGMGYKFYGNNDDYHYIMYSAGKYMMTIFQDDGALEDIYDVSFEYCTRGVGGLNYLLSTCAGVAMFKIETAKDLLDIVSRIDIRACKDYPMEKMVGVIRNIMNDKALNVLEG